MYLTLGHLFLLLGTKNSRVKKKIYNAKNDQITWNDLLHLLYLESKHNFWK